MADGAVSLTLSPDSKVMIRQWGRDRVRETEMVIDTWLDRIAAWMLRETGLAFDNSAQRGGSAWPDNPPWYAGWKAQFGATKPGFLTGSLKRSFAQNVKISKSAKTAQIGSTLVYARAFYYGKRQTWAGVITGPGGRNPAWFMFHGMKPRPFFPEEHYRNRHASQLFVDLLRWKMRTA